MQMQPINNCLMVELETHQKSSSGLELPIKEEDKSLRAGRVVAIPQGSDNIEGIKVGDKVVFGEYAYDTLLFEGQYYIFIDFKDLIAKIC